MPFLRVLLWKINLGLRLVVRNQVPFGLLVGGKWSSIDDLVVLWRSRSLDSLVFLLNRLGNDFFGLLNSYWSFLWLLMVLDLHVNF